MRQRGRRSAAATLIEPHVNGTPSRLTPPSSLTNSERSAFIELVVCCAPEHFRESDVALLVSFVQASEMAKNTVHDPAKVEAWERAVRVQMALARSLRLTPQSRTAPRTVARQRLPEGPFPWE